MRYRTIGVILVTVLTAMFASAASAATVDVELGVYWFCDPSYQEAICETTITVGDTVLWENVAGLHTVTECNPDFTVCPPDGGFDSGFFNTGDSYSYTFTSQGTFSYWCALHPIEMLGRVIVQESTPTPAPTPEPTPTPVGQTPGPMPDVTATPAAVPGTGGPLGPVQPDLPLGVLIAGVVLSLISAVAVTRLSATSR